MRIVGARWRPETNILRIQCHCGHRFPHPANRSWIDCPECRAGANLHKVRRRQYTAA
jgi:hypothetical protein